MKVSIYKGSEGELSLLFQASVGKGRAPLMIPNVSLDDIRKVVGPAVECMRRPRGAELPSTK